MGHGAATALDELDELLLVAGYANVFVQVRHCVGVVVLVG